MGFFALALVGWACEVSPLLCGLRALAGAAVLFVMVRFAGKVVVSIMADAAVRNSASRGNGVDANRDRKQPL